MHGKVSYLAVAVICSYVKFGVVLLEPLSGRKLISNEHPKGQESLLIWAKKILKEGKVSQMLDPSLGIDYNHDQIGRMILAATLHYQFPEIPSSYQPCFQASARQ